MGDLEEDYDDEVHYIEISMTEDNKDFYNENILKELGVDVEVSVIFRTNYEYDASGKKMMGGERPEYEQITIPYRYFYSGLNSISNLFVFSKTPIKSSSKPSYSLFQNNNLPSQAKPSTSPNLISRFLSLFSSNSSSKKIPSPIVPIKSSDKSLTLLEETSPTINSNLPSQATENPSNLPSQATTNSFSSPLCFDEKMNISTEKNNLPSQATENPYSFSSKQNEKENTLLTEASPNEISPDSNMEEKITIRIKITGKMQELNFTYNELLQERLWIEKAISMNKCFIDWDYTEKVWNTKIDINRSNENMKLYKVNNKIILIGDLLSFSKLKELNVFEEENLKTKKGVSFFSSSTNVDVLPKSSMNISMIEREVRYYEFKRFNTLYPGVLNRLKNTELYKRILFGIKE